MANEFAGMFQNPALIREDRLAALQQQQAAQRQMGGSMSGLLGQVAAGAGGVMAEGLASIMGLKTAQESQADAAQSIMQSIDPADPESYTKASQALMAAKLPEAAQAVLEKGRQIKFQNSAEARAEAAEGRAVEQFNLTKELHPLNVKNLKTSINAQEFALKQQQAKAGRDEQERGLAAKYGIVINPEKPDMIKYYGELVDAANKEGRSDLAVKYAEQITELQNNRTNTLRSSLGSISATRYTPAGAAELEEMRMDLLTNYEEGTPDYVLKLKEFTERQKFWSTEANAANAARARSEARASAEGEAEVERLTTQRNELDAQVKKAIEDGKYVEELKTKVIDPLNEGKLWVGFAADQRLDAAKLAEALGIEVPEWQEKAANSEQAMMMFNNQIVAIIKQLGANPSNADREFLQKTLPTLTTSEEGMRKAYRYLVLRANQQVKDAQDRKAYFDKNNTLDGFESKALDSLSKFLEAEGIAVDAINEEWDGNQKFSKSKQQEFKSNMAPFATYRDLSGNSYDIFAYPEYKISPNQILNKYGNNIEALVNRANLIEGYLIDNSYPDETRANYLEEFNAITAAVSDLSQQR